jgi:fatty acid desaturase
MTETEAFRELRATLRKHGYFGRPTGRIVLELVLHVLVAIAGVSLFLVASNWWWRVCGFAALALGSMGVGTNTHTSSHSATSDKPWINEFLTYFGYPFCFGLSATYWRYKHVLNHHSSPNMKGVDGDYDLFPWFAGTADDIRRSSGWRRIYYEHLQVLVFPIAVGLTLPGQQLSGAVHLIRLLRDRERRHSGHWIDLFSLLIHVAVCLVIPLMFFSAGNVIAFYIVRDVINSYVMFVIFAPAHMPAAAARLSKDPAWMGHPVAQTLTTLNFKTGRLGRMMCSGLEYQIEHHLLPDISHVYYPQVSVFVEEFCRKHALPYRRYAWAQGIWLSLLSIRTPSPIETIESVEHSASIGGIR